MPVSWPSDFDPFLALQQPEVIQQLTVVRPRDLGRNFLLHMSKDAHLKALTPYVTARAKSDENRTVNRVSMSPNIAACILGYENSVKDFFQGKDGKDGTGTREVRWRGGWYLYAVPFRYALKPATGLLADGDRTGEHWLVTYNEATRVYTPQPVGKFFYRTLQYRGPVGQQTLTAEIIVAITSKVGIPFGPKTLLAPGYWRVITSQLFEVKALHEVEVSKVTALTEAEYEAIKVPIADLLSHQESRSMVQAW